MSIGYDTVRISIAPVENYYLFQFCLRPYILCLLLSPNSGFSLKVLCPNQYRTLEHYINIIEDYFCKSKRYIIKLWLCFKNGLQNCHLYFWSRLPSKLMIKTFLRKVVLGIDDNRMHSGLSLPLVTLACGSPYASLQPFRPFLKETPLPSSNTFVSVLKALTGFGNQ